MSTLIDSARSALYRDEMIVVVMDSGGEIRFPIRDNPRLARGTSEQLSNIEISPFGLHWPDLDEDLSFRGLLVGDHGEASNNRPAAGNDGIASRLPIEHHWPGVPEPGRSAEGLLVSLRPTS